MRLVLLIALGLTVTACSDAAPTPDATSTSSAPAATSTGSVGTSAPGDTATTVPSTTSSSSTTAATPTTTARTGIPALRLEEIAFAGDPYLIVGNSGDGPGTTEGYWVCQPPSCYELPAVVLEPGNRLVVPLGEERPPPLVGVVATADVENPLGAVSWIQGEVGLYTSDDFSSADAVVDYVEWGRAGHMGSAAAVGAGMWISGGFVVVSPEMLAIVAETFPTTGPGDWYAEVGG